MLVNIEDLSPAAPAPALCLEVGKECRDCISTCASTIASLCPSLDPMQAHSFFLRLYPHAGCFAMARTFVREYLAEAENFLPAVVPFIPSIQPQIATEPYASLTPQRLCA
jgi:hypothetical protein